MAIDRGDRRRSARYRERFPLGTRIVENLAASKSDFQVCSPVPGSRLSPDRKQSAATFSAWWAATRASSSVFSLVTAASLTHAIAASILATKALTRSAERRSCLAFAVGSASARAESSSASRRVSWSERVPSVLILDGSVLSLMLATRRPTFVSPSRWAKGWGLTSIPAISRSRRRVNSGRTLFARFSTTSRPYGR